MVFRDFVQTHAHELDRIGCVNDPPDFQRVIDSEY